MDIQGNLSWLFSQPAAFWLTALLLAILANFLTKMLQSGYVKSISKLKYANIKFGIRVVKTAIPYLLKEKTFEFMVFHYLRLLGLSVCALTVLSIMPMISIMGAIKGENSSYYIVQAVFTIMAAFMLYSLNREAKKLKIIRDLYRKVEVFGEFSPSMEGLISFAAKHTRSNVEDVKLVLDADSSLSLQVRSQNA